MRDDRGRLLPGHTANPGGRNGIPPEIRALLNERGGPKAIAKLIELIDHEDPRVATIAARDIADRTYGKAAEAIEVTGGAHEALASWLLGKRDRDEDK